MRESSQWVHAALSVPPERLISLRVSPDGDLTRLMVRFELACTLAFRVDAPLASRPG
jgi:hypothetical protein